MTSTPASRSARAMILAPRSCPSSPGLATRILRRWGFSLTSNPRRVAVDAELVAVDVADLAERDPLLHRGDQQRHEVPAVAARGTHVGEARRDARVVARRLERLHALDLLLLDL